MSGPSQLHRCRQNFIAQKPAIRKQWMQLSCSLPVLAASVCICKPALHVSCPPDAAGAVTVHAAWHPSASRAAPACGPWPPGSAVQSTGVTSLHALGHGADRYAMARCAITACSLTMPAVLRHKQRTSLVSVRARIVRSRSETAAARRLSFTSASRKRDRPADSRAFGCGGSMCASSCNIADRACTVARHARARPVEVYQLLLASCWTDSCRTEVGHPAVAGGLRAHAQLACTSIGVAMGCLISCGCCSAWLISIQ